MHYQPTAEQEATLKTMVEANDGLTYKHQSEGTIEIVWTPVEAEWSSSRSVSVYLPYDTVPDGGSFERLEDGSGLFRREWTPVRVIGDGNDWHLVSAERHLNALTIAMMVGKMVQRWADANPIPPEIVPAKEAPESA